MGKPLCDERKKIGKSPWKLGDKRVAVVVPMAHVYYAKKALLRSSAKQLKVPVVMIASNLDTTAVLKDEAEPLYADLPGQAALMTLLGGSHYSFINLCALKAVASGAIKVAMEKSCAPTAKPTMGETHDAISKVATAAFDIWLKGDDSKRAVFIDGKDSAGIYAIKSKQIVK